MELNTEQPYFYNNNNNNNQFQPYFNNNNNNNNQSQQIQPQQYYQPQQFDIQYQSPLFTNTCTPIGSPCLGSSPSPIPSPLFHIPSNNNNTNNTNNNNIIVNIPSPQIISCDPLNLNNNNNSNNNNSKKRNNSEISPILSSTTSSAATTPYFQSSAHNTPQPTSDRPNNMIHLITPQTLTFNNGAPQIVPYISATAFPVYTFNNYQQFSIENPSIYTVPDKQVNLESPRQALYSDPIDTLNNNNSNNNNNNNTNNININNSFINYNITPENNNNNNNNNNSNNNIYNICPIIKDNNNNNYQPTPFYLYDQSQVLSSSTTSTNSVIEESSVQHIDKKIKLSESSNNVCTISEVKINCLSCNKSVESNSELNCCNHCGSSFHHGCVSIQGTNHWVCLSCNQYHPSYNTINNQQWIQHQSSLQQQPQPIQQEQPQVSSPLIQSTISPTTSTQQVSSPSIKNELEDSESDSDNNDDTEEEEEDESSNNESSSNSKKVKKSLSSSSNEAKAKGHWTKEEDEKLRQLVDLYGTKRWKYIASLLCLRNGRQCRERWSNQLDPSIKRDAWTLEEDKIILEAHAKFGNKWAEISKLVPGRTNCAIKNHWNSTMKRKLSKKQYDFALLNISSSTIAALSSLTSSSPSPSLSDNSTPSSSSSSSPITEKFVVNNDPQSLNLSSSSLSSPSSFSTIDSIYPLNVITPYSIYNNNNNNNLNNNQNHYTNFNNNNVNIVSLGSSQKDESDHLKNNNNTISSPSPLLLSSSPSPYSSPIITPLNFVNINNNNNNNNNNSPLPSPSPSTPKSRNYKLSSGPTNNCLVCEKVSFVQPKISDQKPSKQHTLTREHCNYFNIEFPSTENKNKQANICYAHYSSFIRQLKN